MRLVQKPTWQPRGIPYIKVYPEVATHGCSAWPSAQGMVYLVPTKYLFQPSPQAHLTEMAFFFVVCKKV